MTDRQLPSDRSIIDCLAVHYALEVKSLTPLSGGADMNAALYKVQTPDQSAYFVKLKQNQENDLHLTLLELLHESGLQQIIPPIKTIAGQATLRLGECHLTLYPFIEGVNGFSHKLTETQWIALGKALRRLHDFEVPSSFAKQIRQETYSPQWRQAVRTLYANLDNEPASKDTITLKFLTVLREKRAIIQRLVDRAELLCDIIKKQPAKFVLCHADIHGGNVLIKESDTLYIVDWDAPILAPKERDLMFIGGGVANVWNDPQEAAFFYKGYGTTYINTSILAYYRHERIVEDIAEYGQALLLTPCDRNDRAEMYHHFISMFAPQGVIDIAFQTDTMRS